MRPRAFEGAWWSWTRLWAAVLVVIGLLLAAPGLFLVYAVLTTPKVRARRRAG